MRKTLSLFAFFTIVANGVFAQTAKDMPSFKPEIKRIAVFKNGYAFTYREGEATTLNGWAYTTNVPIGVMGTVWGYSGTPNTKVQQLLASAADRPDTENIVRVGDLFDFLKVNEGLKVHVDSYDNKTFEGTYSLIGTTADNYSIALQTERGIVVVPPSRIQTVEIIGKPNFEKKVIVKNGLENRLAIRTDGAKDGQSINLGIAALERGIRWIPAYRVEVKGEPIKEAKLELEAVLVNELADLNNSEVYFVVGVPSFAFKDMLSPLSMNQAFAGVSGYFATTGQNFATNAIMTQQTQRMGETADESGLATSPTTPEDEQTTSLSAEQLYLYKTDQLNLKKGERTSLRLFSLTIPATEVFEWTVTDPPRPAGDEYAPRVSLGQDLSSGVWYSLRLKNDTGMPLTTAPAITFREWKPLGQDMIKFTPTGGENILRVSPATEVIGTNGLEEKAREPVSLRMNGSTYSFDLITVEGTLKINNVKKQPVEMAITRNINGEVISATDGGKIKREGLNLQSVNPNSVIKWNVTVPPGEKEIKYTYKIYIRK